MGDEEDEENDGIEWERVRMALRDEGGSIQWGNVVTAVRHEFDVGDALILVGGTAGMVMWATDMTVFWGTLSVLAYVVVVGGIFLAESVNDFYKHDRDVAIRALRGRYAAGEISFEEFQAQVDRVVAGEEVAVFDDEATGGEEQDDAATDGKEGDVGTGEGETPPGEDPIEILRTRFARGEVDEAEFERRLERLRETGDGAVAPPSDRRADREEAFET